MFASSQRMSFPLCQILSVFCSAMRTPGEPFGRRPDKRGSPSIIACRRNRFVFSVSAALLRPQPAERAGGEQSVNQAVEDVLERYAPVLALPDGVLNKGKRVSGECK